MTGFFRLVLELFLLYVAYKVIFDFIIPVYRASKKMKDKVREAHQRMQEQQNSQQNQDQEPPKTRVSEGDYIDYEEVK